LLGLVQHTPRGRAALGSHKAAP